MRQCACRGVRRVCEAAVQRKDKRVSACSRHKKEKRYAHVREVCVQNSAHADDTAAGIALFTSSAAASEPPDGRCRCLLPCSPPRRLNVPAILAVVCACAAMLPALCALYVIRHASARDAACYAGAFQSSASDARSFSAARPAAADEEQTKERRCCASRSASGVIAEFSASYFAYAEVY